MKTATDKAPKEDKQSLKEQKEEISIQIRKLMDKKNEINKELKRLKDVSVYNGCAKLDVKPPTRHNRNTFYSLSLQSKMTDGNCRWFPVVTSTDKKEVLQAIPNIVSSLQGLYEKCQEGITSQ